MGLLLLIVLVVLLVGAGRSSRARSVEAPFDTIVQVLALVLFAALVLYALRLGGFIR